MKLHFVFLEKLHKSVSIGTYLHYCCAAQQLSLELYYFPLTTGSGTVDTGGN